MRATVACAASTADCAPTWARAAPDGGGRGRHLGARGMHGGLDAAHAGAVVVQFLIDEAPSRDKVSERARRRRAASSSLALRHHGLGRQLVALRGLGGGAGHAVDRALLLGPRPAANRVSTCMRASGWPAATKSPS